MPFLTKFKQPTKEERTKTIYFNDYELAQLRDWLNSRTLEAEPGLAKGVTYKLEDENVGVGNMFKLTHIQSDDSVEFSDSESW